MLALFAASLALVATGCSSGGGQRSPEAVKAPTVDELVATTLREGPGRGSSAYQTPNPSVIASLVATLREMIQDVHPLAPAGFAIVKVGPLGEPRDAGTAALVELPRAGRTSGQGLYVVNGSNVEGTLRRVVQVPHPTSDRLTEDLGAEIFKALAKVLPPGSANMLMVAGAHQTADGGRADVAHNSDTAFAAISDSFVQSGTVAVQLHGFDEGAHDGVGDAVVSTGDRSGSLTARRVVQALTAAGFDVCAYGGTICTGLGATTNVQGVHARAAGAAWVHVELSARLRQEPGQSSRVVAALVAALT